MKIAISAENNNGMDSQVAGHFGHAPYFAFVEVEDGQVKSVSILQNPFLAGHQPGQIPGFVHNQGAEVMLSGGMGGRAIQFFEQLGIGVATGAAGTLQNAIDAYLKGDLTEAAPCANSVEHGHGGDHHHHH